MAHTDISYEDCERRGYSSGVEIERVGYFYSKLFQNRKHPEYWFVSINGAVRHIEEKNVDRLLLNWFEPSELNAVMAYLKTGKFYSW